MIWFAHVAHTPDGDDENATDSLSSIGQVCRIPDDPSDAVTPIDGVYDKPSRAVDLLNG